MISGANSWGMEDSGRRCSLHRALRLAIAIATVVSTTGCGLTAAQKAAVSQFARASATLGGVTTTEIVRMRDSAVVMNSEYLKLVGRPPQKNLAGPDTLDRGFDVERVEALTALASVLRAYGKSLLSLVDDSQSATLKASADSLVSSLGRIDTVKEHLTGEQLSAVGVLVQEVGGLFIEWKRRNAVVGLVVEYHGAIDHVCDLLIRDFRPGPDEPGWVTLQLQVITDLLRGAAVDAFDKGSTYEARAKTFTALTALHTARMRREEIVKRVHEAAVAMKAANAALVNAVERNETSRKDLEAFGTRADALYSAVELLIR